MKRKIVLMAVLAFLFSAIFATQAVSSAQAETDTISTGKPEDPFLPGYFADAVGTYFEITDSPYLNITLTSTETVHVYLESIPGMISVIIESNSSATSTVLTFFGFEPNTMYYRYQDGDLIEEFTANSSGGYAFTQDIHEPHHVYIEEDALTIYIGSDYTFTNDIYDNIVVTADNIVIDGNGYTLQGPGAYAGPPWTGFSLNSRSGVSIKNVIIKGWLVGISIWYSDNNTIIGNTISNNWVGIEVSQDSSYNTINGNKISNNDYYGIRVEHQGPWELIGYNTIIGNTISNNMFGMGLWYSGSNILRDNNMADNTYNFGVEGNRLSNFIQDIDTSNTVNGKPIYYWMNQENVQVPADAGYVGVVNSTGITVKDLTLTNNQQAVLLAYTTNSTVENVNVSNNWDGIEVLRDSSYNTIIGNTISNHYWHGIALSANSSYNTIIGNTISNNSWSGIALAWYSSGNTISENAIANSYYGIMVCVSSSNLIYHNNIVDNSLQVIDVYWLWPWIPQPSINMWDDGYPSGGNYWSDYTGADFYSGPNQDQVGSDGIGDTPYVIYPDNVDHYPFMCESGWEKIQFQITFDHLGVGSDFTGTVVIIDGIDYGVGDLPVSFWWDEGSTHTFAFQSPLLATPNATQHLWNSTTGLSTQQNETITVSASGSIIGNYKTQHYLTVTSPFDTPGGEGWYDEGETAYAILAIGLEYINSLAYGFVGWSGDATGWDLISDPIIIDAPKTAIANWESSEVYGDVRTVGFWKHQVNVWYFTELKNDGMKIRGIGTAQVTEDELIIYLAFISQNSNYTLFQNMVVYNTDGTVNKLETMRNVYNILKTPRGPDSMKMRAEQQLLAVWLNLAYKAFFWNTQLSQDTIYVYYQCTFDEFDGLATIGEAIKFCEAELLNNGNFEAVKDICDSINNNLGIIWGT